ncbi:MAG: extracellular solute-binding protein [Caldilineaceae bacterium]
MVQVAAAGQLVDWTPFAEADSTANLDDYFPQQVGFYTYNNGLYALPYYSGPSCIWYNEDIFREKGSRPRGNMSKGDLDLGDAARTRFTNHRR